jgi:hypothetical protein
MQFANGGHGDEHGGDGEGLTKGGLGSPPPPPLIPPLPAPCHLCYCRHATRPAPSLILHPLPPLAIPRVVYDGTSPLPPSLAAVVLSCSLHHAPHNLSPRTLLFISPSLSFISAS